MLPSLVLNFMRHPKVAGRLLRPVSRRKISAYVLPEHLRIPATARVLDRLKAVAAAKDVC